VTAALTALPRRSFVRYGRHRRRARAHSLFAAAIAYRSQFIVWILATNTPPSCWRSGLPSHARRRSVTSASARSSPYFLLTLIVRLLTARGFVWEMNLEIKDGTLSQRLLRPVHPFLVYAVDNLAASRCASSCRSRSQSSSWPPWRAPSSRPTRSCGWPRRSRSSGGGSSRSRRCWRSGRSGSSGRARSRSGTCGSRFTSSSRGTLFPLELFPRWLLRWVAVSPFPYTLSFPVETMLGMTSRADVLSGLAKQYAYGVGFLVLALWLWRRGLVRYAAYGG